MLEKLQLTAKDILFHYWIHLLAIAAFAFCLWRLISIHPIEEALVPGIAALFGLISTVAPDEVSDWTGYYGWTTQQYRNKPPAAIRFFGIIVLAATVIYLW